MRIEGMELDSVVTGILDRYASGEISLDEASQLMKEYSTTIVGSEEYPIAHASTC
jgi:hypothetical protein